MTRPIFLHHDGSEEDASQRPDWVVGRLELYDGYGIAAPHCPRHLLTVSDRTFVFEPISSCHYELLGFRGTLPVWQCLDPPRSYH
jgi:hypothetical protein